MTKPRFIRCIGAVLILLTFVVSDANAEDALYFTREQIEEAHASVQLRIDDIPDHVVSAFVASEDRRFWERRESKRISKITAYVAQMLLNEMTDERTRLYWFVRLASAKYLMLLLDDRSVLEIFLSKVYLGRGAYGIEDAALAYFEKPVQDLTISDAAFLATLAKDPTFFGKDENQERTLDRMDFVLGEMVEMGAITEEERQLASQDRLDAAFEN